MKKSIALFISIIMLFTFMATGCKRELPELDLDKTALYILDTLYFDDDLVSATYGLAHNYILFPEDTRFALYMGSGGTAETVGVFKSTNEEDVKATQAAVDKYLVDLTITFTDYNSSELDRIKNAYTYSEGLYTFLIVSKDKAESEKLVDDILDGKMS